MSKIEFTNREKGMIKNTAKAVYPLYSKLYKLESQLEELQAEIEKQRNEINNWETGVRGLTGGYSSMDLCERKVDEKKHGYFEFRYGENVLPPEDVEETSDPTPVHAAPTFDPMAPQTANC